MKNNAYGTEPVGNMYCKLLLVCSLLGLAFAAVPSEALQVADIMRECFNNLERDSTAAGKAMEDSFYQLLDKIPEGRSLIDKCDRSGISTQAFLLCIAGDVENLRQDALSSLGDLKTALNEGSENMDSIVSQGVLCITNVISNAM